MHQRLFQRLSILIAFLCVGEITHAAPGDVSTTASGKPAVNAQPPAKADTGNSTLILATGIGLLVIGASTTFTLFPPRRRPRQNA